MPPPISAEDQERIRTAVAEAERRTAGEIVPYIVSRSGGYEIALWRGAVAGMVAVTAVVLLALQAYDGWGLGWAYTAWGMVILVGLGGLIGAVLPAFVPAVRRVLAGKGRLLRTVHRRAEVAFLEEEVFNTRDRSGILLFVSLFEHRIEVVGDSGINAAVERDAWIEVVDLIRTGIERGDLVGGLCAAIARCGEMLEACGLSPHCDDPNELPNEVRLRRQ
jgi:putative membrane protein